MARSELVVLLPDVWWEEVVVVLWNTDSVRTLPASHTDTLTVHIAVRHRQMPTIGNLHILQSARPSSILSPPPPAHHPAVGG